MMVSAVSAIYWSEHATLYDGDEEAVGRSEAPPGLLRRLDKLLFPGLLVSKVRAGVNRSKESDWLLE